MSDWDDLEDEARVTSAQYGSRCSVLRMIETIGEEHGEDARRSVVRTLGNSRLTTNSIRAALERRVAADILPSQYTINRHRGRRCTCPKEAS